MDGITVTRDVVVNGCYGGYGLSVAAMRELASRKGLVLREEKGFLFVGDTHRQVDDVVPRDDPDLVAVVREMGAAANGGSADLRVVTVAMTIAIGSRDGLESVSVHGSPVTFPSPTR